MRNGGRLGLLTKTIGIAAVSTALLAACSGNTPEPSSESPKKTPQAEPTPSKTPTPTRTLSEDQKRVAAINTALDWLKASNNAMKTLDPAPMLAMSDPSCENCQNLAKYLHDTKKNGGHFEGDFAERTVGTEASRDLSKPPQVTVTVRTGDWTYYAKPGAKPEKNKAGRYEIEFDMKWEGGKWTVTENRPIQ